MKTSVAIEKQKENQQNLKNNIKVTDDLINELKNFQNQEEEA